MRRGKTSKKKKKMSRHLKMLTVVSRPREVEPDITPKELARRAEIKEIFRQIEILRRRVKPFPKGVTIESLIRQGRRF
jgi:hypothetical protein